jgi:hypothetical protein
MEYGHNRRQATIARTSTSDCSPTNQRGDSLGVVTGDHVGNAMRSAMFAKGDLRRTDDGPGTNA